MVAIELAYINTKHPDFYKDAALVSSLLKGSESIDDHGSPMFRVKSGKTPPGIKPTGVISLNDVLFCLHSFVFVMFTNHFEISSFVLTCDLKSVIRW